MPVWFSRNFNKLNLIHESSFLYLVCNTLILFALLDNDFMIIVKDAAFIYDFHWIFCELGLIYKVSDCVCDSHALKFLFEVQLILKLSILLQMLFGF